MLAGDGSMAESAVHVWIRPLDFLRRHLLNSLHFLDHHATFIHLSALNTNTGPIQYLKETA